MMETEPGRALDLTAGGQLPAWLSVLHYPSIGSTNSELLSMLRPAAQTTEPLQHAILIYSSEQTDGRGSRGREWQQGGPGLDIAMTLGVRKSSVHPACRSLLDDPRLTLFVGSVCAKALEKSCGMPISLKWPNDLLCAERKCGGILCESFENWVIIGLGVNVNSQPGQYRESGSGLSTLSDCAGRELDLAELQLEAARALAYTFALPPEVIATQAEFSGLHLTMQPPAAELLCIDEAGRQYSLSGERLMRDWQQRDQTGGKRYRLLRGEGVAVTSERVDMTTGALICRGDDGQEYLVQSYTELEQE